MAEIVWIPAFAGMTKIKTRRCKPIKGGKEFIARESCAADAP